MKKIFFSILCFLFIISLYARDSKVFINTSAGYISGHETFQGVATNFGIGYNANKYLSIELVLDNWYRYDDNSASDTNTGISMLLHAYPINFKGNTLDIFAGYGYNMNYWRYVDGNIGRHLFPAPLFGAGYYRSFKYFDLGFVYKKDFFIGRINKQNEQYLISVKKRF